MHSRASEESDRSEVSATKKGEGKQNAVFEVDGVPMHYKREVGNMITSILCRKVYHASVCREDVLFWRKA